MSAPLADALRQLGLPLDETIDDGELGEAYRRAARENHPDGAPDEERERRGETMRAINAARGLVQSPLEVPNSRAGVTRPQRARERQPRAGLVGRRDLRGSLRAGRALESGRGAHPVAPALRAGAARALHRRRRHRHGRARGRALARARRGLRQLGASAAAPPGAGSRRAAPDRRRGALPRRLALDGRRGRRARRGLALPRVRAHEHARRAARAPCPRCIRRSRIDYERWDDLGRRWRRLHRRLRELDRVAAPFCAAALPGLPRRRRRARRRPPARRVAATPRSRRSTRHSPRRGRRVAEVRAARAARTRTGRRRAGAARRRAKYAAEAKRVRRRTTARAILLDEQRVRVVELDRERTRLERELRARHEASERARRHSQAKRDGRRRRRAPGAAHGRDRAERRGARCDRAAGRVRQLASGAGQVIDRRLRAVVALAVTRLWRLAATRRWIFGSSCRPGRHRGPVWRVI